MYFTQEQINNLEKSWKLVSEPGGRAKSTIHPLLLKANIDRFYRLQFYLNLNLKISFCTQGGGLTEANTPGTGIRQSDSPQKLLYIHLYIICHWADVFLQGASLSPRLWLFITEQALSSKWRRHRNITAWLLARQRCRTMLWLADKWQNSFTWTASGMEKWCRRPQLLFIFSRCWETLGPQSQTLLPWGLVLGHGSLSLVNSTPDAAQWLAAARAVGLRWGDRR